MRNRGSGPSGPRFGATPSCQVDSARFAREIGNRVAAYDREIGIERREDLECICIH